MQKPKKKLIQPENVASWVTEIERMFGVDGGKYSVRILLFWNNCPNLKLEQEDWMAGNWGRSLKSWYRGEQREERYLVRQAVKCRNAHAKRVVEIFFTSETPSSWKGKDHEENHGGSREATADNIINQAESGLADKQRKRVIIGVKLAAKPELLLFLNEPTSGLDAQSAFNIVRFLKKLMADKDYPETLPEVTTLPTKSVLSSTRKSSTIHQTK